MHKLIAGLFTGLAVSSRCDCSWYVTHFEELILRLHTDIKYNLPNNKNQE